MKWLNRLFSDYRITTDGTIFIPEVKYNYTWYGIQSTLNLWAMEDSKLYHCSCASIDEAREIITRYETAANPPKPVIRVVEYLSGT